MHRQCVRFSAVVRLWFCLIAVCGLLPSPANAGDIHTSWPRVLVEHGPTATSDSNAARDGGDNSRRVTQGTLRVVGASDGANAECPLKHTSVKAEISGFVARVRVEQEFVNESAEWLEAVYTFPLPHRAAVDEMTLRVGERTVRARIMRRAEAEAVYEAARAAGQTATRLDEERPNVFTQRVANVAPWARVTIALSYVELLAYEDGGYEFVFPMVVGPRYVPGTEAIHDASLITPPVAPPGTRAGHDLSLEVTIDAGVPVDTLRSILHEVDTEAHNGNLSVRLRQQAEIPNRDFILKYHTASGRIEEALLAHRDSSGDGYFTLILQPPARVAEADVTARELVFVLDTSGSMSGFPLDKAKEVMSLALAAMRPRDSFNLITFAGDTRILFPAPVPATTENLRRAQTFLAHSEGGGGTEMMTAICAALAPSGAAGRVRVVCFMTDGYVGNDWEIIGEVQRQAQARVFAFGVGDSVNRLLLDKLAEAGRGEVEYVTLDGDGSRAVRRFHERVRSPLLTDIGVDWGGLPVADVYPRRLPDLFAAKPLVMIGRYTSGGRGIVRLQGTAANGQTLTREIEIDLPNAEPRHDALASLWARQRIDELTAQDYDGAQRRGMRADLQDQITQLGLKFQLLTPFTSFVAVEETIRRVGRHWRTIEVPVEIPSGINAAGEANGAQAFAGNAHAYAFSQTAKAFTMSEMVKNVGPVNLTVITTLLLMSLMLCVRLGERLFTLTRAGRGARRAASRLAQAIGEAPRPAELLAFSERQPASHLARLVSAGLRDVADVDATLTRTHIEVAELALRRAVARQSAEFARGLTGLAMVGSIAPLVGFFGTVLGLVSTLQGAHNAESAGIGAVAGGVAESLLPAALGIAVAVLAVWLYHYSRQRADTLALQMDDASALVMNYLLKVRAHSLER